ncbi:MAG: 2-hydroxyacyl-CoA dehydratase family protein [Sphingomonas paucimobilis]
MDALAAIAAAYADTDAVARRLAGQGEPVIRTIGSDAPFTWLRAAGFAPVRLDPVAGDETPRADAVMGPATGRRRGHRLLERLLDPMLADTPILLTRADAEQAQLFAALRERLRLGEPAPARLHLLDLVHQDQPASHRYNLARLERLDGWLQQWGGAPVDDDRLAAAATEERALLILVREAQQLRREARLAGSDMLRIIGCTAILPPHELADLLRTLVAKADTLPLRHGRRTLVTGTAHDDANLYTGLEADGLFLAGDDHDWGERRLIDPPITCSEAAAPVRQAPLGARWPKDTAASVLRTAQACEAELVLHVTIDGDEAAPWSEAAVTAALKGKLAFEARRPAPPSAPAKPPVKAPPPPRSRKSLQSLTSFGTYQRDWFQQVRQQVADGAPFAMVNANAPQEILRALDIPFVVNQWWASIVAAKQQTGRYRDLLHAHGYPTDVEAYSAQGLAAGLDDDHAQAPWGGLPQPDFLHAVTSSDATPGIFGSWAEETGAAPFLYERTVDPRLSIGTRWWEELPTRWDEVLEPERIDLLVAELREVIERIERATGRTFSHERFVEVMNLVNEQEEYYRRTRDLIAKTVRAPIGIVDSMPATMVPQWHRGTIWGRDAARAFHDEVAERVAAGVGAVADERVRLMWVGRGLWSETAFYQRWEESHGAVFVWSMYLALAADGYIREHGDGRDPMRALAARFLTMGDELRMPSWAGPWHVHEAESHRIDGAVAVSDADPFVLRALAAAGIPVLELGVDNFAMDADTAAALDRRVTAFIEGPAGDRASARIARGAAA